MKKAYAKPGAKVTIKCLGKTLKATVVESVYSYRPNKLGRVFEVEFRNGHLAYYNEHWFRKGW